MRWVPLIILVLASTCAKEEESNEISPPLKPPINLDANLRRALLKALTELENEEKSKEHEEDDRFVEKVPASALSFFASTTQGTEPTTTTEESTHKPIVIIQRSRGLQHKPIISLEKNQDDEQILTSATSSFTSSDKFKNKEQESLNKIKVTTKKHRPETTTVTTTTSTEESEAKVEDVQFFSAPLVAAFTVHQDERGLPKSVEPIYRTLEKIQSKKELLSTPAPFQEQKNDQIRTQFALQEKQRALEAEILRLRQQQQQHNYLIRQQQILHQQQLELQKQKILDEQSRITQRPFIPTVSDFSQPTTQRPFPDPSRGTLVSFQPSISFNSHQPSSSILPLNAQQLPVKNPGDFRAPFVPPNGFNQFNFLGQQQPPLETALNNFGLAPTASPPLTLTAPRSHRVFRQESNTGNFFNNGNFNQFNQPNRFFRSNVETVRSLPFSFNQAQPPVVNQHLNHLLYNSGLIRGNKQQEDLNIVSKVLSLNHYGGDYRFGSSNVNEQRVPAPVIKKV